MKNLVLFGIQGAGKGTQAKKILEKNPEFAYFSPGDIYRLLVRHGGEIFASKYVQQKIDKGELVPDIVTNKLFERISTMALDAKKSLLIDGYPRTYEQMEFMFKTFGTENFIGLYIKISEQEALKRMKSRAREDDTDEIIKVRLQNFYEKTLPMIEEFGKRAKLIEINGEQTINEVFVEIQEKLENLL